MVRTNDEVAARARDMGANALVNLAAYFETDYESELRTWSAEERNRLRAQLETLRLASPSLPRGVRR